MIDSILHRDLSNPLHTTNLTQDYRVPFPASQPGERLSSFFTYPQTTPSGTQTFHPIDPNSIHKPLNMAQFLQKKLRWLTLGTQYDWSTRSYPIESPTPFPTDISAMVSTLFKKSFVPESGVVLIYSPKDYMPVHRDVSEECERKLASFSLGCDGLFIISRDAPGTATSEDGSAAQDMVVIRVRSGDVVEMGGETRWAWHAMPKVMAGTCPDALKDWPVKKGKGTPKEYEKWMGYMKGKRINISCRQVWVDSMEC
jgi:alkylated DNA repair protein alkB family protein 1